jgi:recombination protein RecA
MAKKLTEVSSLNSMIAKFNATMGEGVIHTASSLPNCRKILCSIPAYNYVSCGGFPIGRVIEHFGENGSLKSYTAYDAIAQFQHYDWANHEQGAFTGFSYSGTEAVRELTSFKLRKGYTPKKDPIARRVALVDIEATYTPDWGDNFGIDNEGLILIRPTLLSECVDIVQGLLTDESISLVVFDSLSAVGTDDEVDKSMEENQMASGARFWNKAFRKIQAALNSNPTNEATLLVINSAYTTVGIAYGDPEKVRNGEQLKRTKSLSVRFKGLKEIQGKTDTGDITVGRNIAIKCMKNKVGKPFRTSNFFYAYEDYGNTKANKTDVAGQLVDLAMKFGIVTRKGAWYIYGDVKVQGMDSFVDSLVESGDIVTLEKKIYEEM